jgi:two-component system cell cycle response regulator DivK
VTLVLIVDDSEPNRKLERDLLRRAGLETLEAATGAQARTFATEQLPDVILMDLQLPDANGAEVTRAIAADVRTARIPIVAISALPLEGSEDWLAAVGFAGWIAKPISVDRFADEVSQYVPKAPGSR